jgi:hypothetical protein
MNCHPHSHVRIPKDESEVVSNCLGLYLLDSKSFDDHGFEMLEVVAASLPIHVTKVYYEFEGSYSQKFTSSLSKLKKIAAAQPANFAHIGLDELLDKSQPYISSGVSINASDRTACISFTSTLQASIGVVSRLMSEMARFKPEYGFLNHGPNTAFVFAWAMGISFDGMTDLEEKSVWRLRNKIGSLGSNLHDVYDFNVLSNGHLKQRVGSQSLLDWVKNEKVGKLEEVSSDVFTWELTVEEVRQARRVLVANHLLV